MHSENQENRKINGNSLHSAFSINEEDSQEIVSVNNAGLVLLAPFLPRLFHDLALMSASSFYDEKAKEWAVLLLQYLVCEKNKFCDEELFLNKLIVNYSEGTPINASIRVGNTEKKILNAMLSGFVLHGLRLRNIPVPGVQKSFLRRSGILEHRSCGWYLSVEERSYDGILDRLAWNYSVVDHPWMEEPIYVNWR